MKTVSEIVSASRPSLRMRQSSLRVIHGPFHGNGASGAAAGRLGVPKLARKPSPAAPSTMPATANCPTLPADPMPSRMAAVVATFSFALAAVT